MVVNQEAARRRAGRSQAGNRFRQIDSENRLALPIPQQRRHAAKNFAIVVEAKNERSGNPAVIDARLWRPHLAEFGRRNRNLDREMGAATNLRSERDWMLQHAGDALDNGEAEADAAGNLGSLSETMKLDEYVASPVGRNADTGIVDIDLQPPAAPPASDQHAAR